MACLTAGGPELMTEHQQGPGCGCCTGWAETPAGQQQRSRLLVTHGLGRNCGSAMHNPKPPGIEAWQDMCVLSPVLCELDVFGNRYQLCAVSTASKQAHLLVVIEDDDHVAVQETSMVHGLIGHTTSNSTITNNRNDIVLLALDVTANCHTQTCTDTGAAVASAKGIIFTL